MREMEEFESRKASYIYICIPPRPSVGLGVFVMRIVFVYVSGTHSLGVATNRGVIACQMARYLAACLEMSPRHCVPTCREHVLAARSRERCETPSKDAAHCGHAFLFGQSLFQMN